MKDLQGRTALVTGASGGIGAHIARRLAREGMNVVLSARRGDALEALAAELSQTGVRAAAVPADLGDRAGVESLIDRAQKAIEPLDVLVNNAGLETVGSFTSHTADELTGMVDVNLTAPMLLTHRLLPELLEREHGHVVFIASVAGKVGPAYNVPYAATKAGLIGLTQALRAEYLDAPVGFSVVCPGFVAGEGMYERMAREGHRSNRLMGHTTLERVADAVVRAIVEDRAELIESGAPLRPLLALGQLSPGLVERMAPRFGVTELFRGVAASRGREG